MSKSPPVLLLGESEVDRVEHLFRELGVGFERVHAPRAEMHLPLPGQLLVVAGPFVPRLPTLVPGDAGAEPVRVCIHAQDFLPLRERLREKGFHYLVQTGLDAASLRVFFMQLLHPAANQRASARLPLGEKVEYSSSRESGVAKLVDLSKDGCRLTDAQGLGQGDPVTVVLPPALGGGTPLALQGHVRRCDPANVGTPAYTVLGFSVLDRDARERLDRIVGGELLGARVTLLADPPLYAGAGAPPASPPKESAAPSEAQGDSGERRREDRHPYDGRVEILELPGDADGALGHDLSLDGVRISGGPPLKPGMKVTLALYGGNGAEPVALEAEVIRASPEDTALVFGRLAEIQQERLAALITEQPAFDALSADDPAEGRLVATRVLERQD